MLRLISLLAIAAALAVAFLIPGSASAVVTNGCPPGFVPITMEEAFFQFGTFHGAPDPNGDGFVCVKVTPSGKAVFVDNNVPDPIAEGVTDTGSTVPVDTVTGDILSG